MKRRQYESFILPSPGSLCARTPLSRAVFVLMGNEALHALKVHLGSILRRNLPRFRSRLPGLPPHQTYKRSGLEKMANKLRANSALQKAFKWTFFVTRGALKSSHCIGFFTRTTIHFIEVLWHSLSKSWWISRRLPKYGDLSIDGGHSAPRLGETKSFPQNLELPW